MKWNYIRGWSGVCYYSGRIGDPDCRYIHEHDDRWWVSRDVRFDDLNDAKAWFSVDRSAETCDT